jgi:hypothetical protein
LRCCYCCLFGLFVAVDVGEASSTVVTTALIIGNPLLGSVCKSAVVVVAVVGVVSCLPEHRLDQTLLINSYFVFMIEDEAPASAGGLVGVLGVLPVLTSIVMRVSCGTHVALLLLVSS